MVSITAGQPVFTMAKFSPANRAAERKVQFSASRLGRPWETLDTPNTVLSPFSRQRRRASAAAITSAPLTEAAKVRQSMKKSSLGIPAASPAATIRSARAQRAAGSGEMPSSSKVRAMTAAPYFFTMGRTAPMLSAVPLTEFRMGRPL